MLALVLETMLSSVVKARPTEQQCDGVTACEGLDAWGDGNIMYSQYKFSCITSCKSVSVECWTNVNGSPRINV